MTNSTLEEQKESYARELAAHTLRQWNAVRMSLNGTKKGGEDTSSSTSTTPDECQNSQNSRTERPKVQAPHNADGAQVVDFARISSNPGERDGATSQDVTR